MWGDGRVLPISPLALAPRPAGRLVARSPPQVVCVPACDFLTLRESLRSPAEKQVFAAHRTTAPPSGRARRHVPPPGSGHMILESGMRVSPHPSVLETPHSTEGRTLR